MRSTQPKVRIWLIALVCAAALLLAACEEKTEEPKDECDSTVKPEIEPLFEIHVIAELEGGGPYLGEMDFYIFKTYCNGNESGEFSNHVDSTPGGYWYPMTTQYKMANTEDIVTAQFSVGGGDPVGMVYTYDYVSTHMKLIDYQYIFEDTLYLTVTP